MISQSHRWTGNHAVELKLAGGKSVMVGPGDFVSNIDRDDALNKEYLKNNLLIEGSAPKAKIGDKDA